MNRGDRVPVIVEIGLAFDLSEPRRAEAVADVERAVIDVVRALEIPVEPTFEVSEGSSRLVVGARGIPAEAAPGRLGVPPLHAIWRLAGELVTEEAARLLWREWIGEVDEPGGRAAPIADLHWMLVRGARMGFKLSRFRQAAEKLSREPSPSRRRAELFESSIAGEECRSARLVLSPEVATRPIFARAGVLPVRGAHTELSPWQDEGVLSQVARALFDEDGIALGPISIQVDDHLDSSRFRVEWNDLRLPSIPTPFDAQASVDGPALVEIICALLSGTDGALVNRALVDFHLLRLGETHPVLAKALQRTFDATFLTNVMRALAADAISLRQIVLIAMSMVELAETVTADTNKYIVFRPLDVLASFVEYDDSMDLDRYVTFARMNLRLHITNKYVDAKGKLRVFLVSPQCEARLALRDPLSGPERKELIAAVDDELFGEPPFVVLVPLEIRSRLRDELRSEFPDVHVLSYAELSPHCDLDPVGRIRPDV
jgi:hypothetical protein